MPIYIVQFYIGTWNYCDIDLCLFLTFGPFIAIAALIRDLSGNRAIAAWCVECRRTVGLFYRLLLELVRIDVGEPVGLMALFTFVVRHCRFGGEWVSLV